MKLKNIIIILSFIVFTFISCKTDFEDNKSIVLNSNDTSKYSDKNYIPYDIFDAIKCLDYNLNEEEKLKFKNIEEREAVRKAHFGLGKTIRNKWLYGKDTTRIKKYFKELGIIQVDNISSAILTSFHRYLNGVKFELNKEVEYYKSLREKIKLEQIKQIKIYMKGFKINDTVYYNSHSRIAFFISKAENTSRSFSKSAKGIILKKDTINFNFKIKLTESEEGKSIIIIKDYKTPNIEIKYTDTMIEGDIKWTSFDIWIKKY